MTADPDDGSNATPPGNTPPSVPAPAQPLPKAPRVNPPTAADRQQSAGSKVGLDDLITWLRRMEGTSNPPETATSPTSQAREQRKFRKIEPAAAKVAPVVSDLQENDGTKIGTADDGEKTRGVDGARPLTRVSFKGARVSSGPPRSRLSNVFVQSLILLLMAACFYLGRATLPAAAPAVAQPSKPTPALDGETSRTVPAAELEMLDQAIDAENAGDLTRADAIFSQLRRGSVHIKGLDYEAALLAWQRGDPNAAGVLANQSIAENEKVGLCYSLRAMLGAGSRPQLALLDLEAATQADPFEAKNFFLWGEALRRAGKYQAALVRLREAAKRAESVADRNRYLFKARLAMIELGQQAEFAERLTEAMTTPHPAVEWILTDAAVNLHAGNYAAAAADLNRAQELSGPKIFAFMLQDYFFRQYADQPALAPIFARTAPPNVSAPGDKFVVAPTSDLPAVELAPLPMQLGAAGSPEPTVLSPPAAEPTPFAAPSAAPAFSVSP